MLSAIASTNRRYPLLSAWRAASSMHLTVVGDRQRLRETSEVPQRSQAANASSVAR